MMICLVEPQAAKNDLTELSTYRRSDLAYMVLEAKSLTAFEREEMMAEYSLLEYSLFNRRYMISDLVCVFSHLITELIL